MLCDDKRLSETCGERENVPIGINKYEISLGRDNIRLVPCSQNVI